MAGGVDAEVPGVGIASEGGPGKCMAPGVVEGTGEALRLLLHRESGPHEIGGFGSDDVHLEGKPGEFRAGQIHALGEYGTQCGQPSGPLLVAGDRGDGTGAPGAPEKTLRQLGECVGRAVRGIDSGVSTMTGLPGGNWSRRSDRSPVSTSVMQRSAAVGAWCPRAM